MKLIPTAIVYKAEVPPADLLHLHLEKVPFVECTSLQLRSVGFVPREEHGELVNEFPGGYAWTVRIDEKIIPGFVINAETKKAIAKHEADTGKKPGKKERADIKSAVHLDLATRALVRTTQVTCFYNPEQQYLIVPASKKTADVVVSALVQAVGTVKTETLNVSNVKKGLTTRLKTWLAEDDEDAFGNFHPCSTAVLSIRDEGKRQITVRMTALGQARQALDEALKHGFQVESLGFMAQDGTEFRLTDDFHLKGLAYTVPDDKSEEESMWAAEAGLQVAAVSGILTELCEMMAYDPADAVADEPVAEAA